MIARSWHGVVPLEFGDSFYNHLMKTGVEESGTTSGNLGYHLHREDGGVYAHFFLVTYWEDFGAVRRFAGEDPRAAVDYPEDERYGLISDPVVLHHEIAGIPERFP